MGRGRGFAPVRLERDGGSGAFCLTAVSSGVVQSPMDGRKRPISSLPSLLPSQNKKNRLPSEPDPSSDLSCGDMSQTLMRRIDDFFDPPPCDPSSDLLWSKPHDPLQDVFSDASPPPYIVLMESTRPGKNLGKYDRLALAECIDLVISGGGTIFYNGLNQVKIQCETWEDANTLVRSQDLMRGGFKLFIPSSLIRKKAFTGPIDPKYSASDIAGRLDPALRDLTVAVRRRTNDDGSISSKVEFTMAVSRVPRNVRLLGYSYPLTPVIPPPRRCFNCQRFRHISTQCRSSRPICEFCSEHHRTDSCPNKLRSAFCFNCCGHHVASSRECPVYQYDFEINKYCYWNCCEFGVAELGLRERGILRPGRRLEIGIDRISLEDSPSALHDVDLGFSAPAPCHRALARLSRLLGPCWILGVRRSWAGGGWGPCFYWLFECGFWCLLFDSGPWSSWKITPCWALPCPIRYFVRFLSS